MKKLVYLIIFFLYSTVMNAQLKDLVQYVNTLQGTDSNFGLSYGNTYPTTGMPYGMHMWSAQTGKNGDGFKYMYAVDKLRSLGSKEDVSVYFENCYFPMKSYGDMTFPPGEYEAFRIDIGEASGRNWWCVLYPPLCFVDAVYGVVPDESKDELKNVLTEDEYRVVSGEKVQYRFKYLKFLNKK